MEGAKPGEMAGGRTRQRGLEALFAFEELLSEAPCGIKQRTGGSRREALRPKSPLNFRMISIISHILGYYTINLAYFGAILSK
jgi:hypothetical protein